MARRGRKRWPVTNTDELVRHVARQFPEINRRQVQGIIHCTMTSLLQSLGDQAAEGFERPTVKVRHFGTFELRWYKETRRPHVNGTVRVVPARWRFGFRPSTRWGPLLESWSDRTRKTSEDRPQDPQLERTAWSDSPDSDEEASPDLSDVRANGGEA